MLFTIIAHGATRTYNWQMTCITPTKAKEQQENQFKMAHIIQNNYILDAYKRPHYGK